MAPSDTPSELVAKGSNSHRRWYPYIFNSNNIPAFLQTPYMHTLSSGNLQQKRKKAREATSIGGSTAFARTLIMQSLYLFYRTPIKVRVKRCSYNNTYTGSLAVSTFTSGLSCYGKSLNARRRYQCQTIFL